MTNYKYPNVPTQDLISNPHFESEYLAVVNEARALSPNELAKINVDITQACSVVLAKMPGVQAQRASMQSALNDFDVATLDKLERYTKALLHANSLAITSSSPKNLMALAARGAELRSQLLYDAHGLARRGFIGGARLEEIKGYTGYRNVAVDLNGLTTVLRSNWEKCKGKTAVTEEELAEAQSIVEALYVEMGRREENMVSADAADMRARIYTLFVRTHDEVKQAISYVRWKAGDAAEILPSIFAGRNRKPTSDVFEEEGLPEDNDNDSPIVSGPINGSSNGIVQPQNGSGPFTS